MTNNTSSPTRLTYPPFSVGWLPTTPNGRVGVFSLGGGGAAATGIPNRIEIRYWNISSTGDLGTAEGMEGGAGGGEDQEEKEKKINDNQEKEKISNSNDKNYNNNDDELLIQKKENQNNSNTLNYHNDNDNNNSTSKDDNCKSNDVHYKKKNQNQNQNEKELETKKSSVENKISKDMGTEMMWSGKSTSYGNGLLYVAGARNIYVLSIESLEILTSAELYAHEKEPEKKLVNTSINGEYIAVTDDRYDIHIFHVLISRNKSNDSFSVSLKQIRTIDKPHTREITGISFSQDASFLISCSKDRKAKLWNLEMNHEKKENKTIKHEENQEDRMKRISAYDFQLPCPQPIPGTYRGCSFVYTKNSTKTNENKTSESKLSIVLCIAGGRRVPSQLLLIDGSTGQVTKTRSIKGDRITAFSDVFRNGVHHVFIGTTSGRLMGFEADSLRRTFRCPGNGAVHDAVTACALEPSIRIELDSNIKDHHHNRNNNNNNNNTINNVSHENIRVVCGGLDSTLMVTEMKQVNEGWMGKWFFLLMVFLSLAVGLLAIGFQGYI